MKYNKIIGITAILVVVFSYCRKGALDVAPIGLVDESIVANQKGVEELLIGAYSLLDGTGAGGPTIDYWGASGSNWIYGSICGSEAYKGSDEIDQSDMITPLETFTATSANRGVAQKWQTVYAGVQRANEVLRVMAKATDISSEDRIRIAAEARFLRGFYHFEAIKIFGEVPYVDETITYAAGNYYLSNDTLIWPAIENDFEFAMENLRAKMNAVGRANKYAAEAFLAKAKLFQQNYAGALPLLRDLINNGVTAGGIPYKLLDHYADNFNPATKNSSEAVFSAQASVIDGSQGLNGNIGDILNFPYIPIDGACCGFFKPSQYLVNHFKTVAVTGLPDPDDFNNTDVKNDQGIPSSSAFIPYPGFLDPRLDWTVGRRGIPYLDWGNHPGEGWARNQPYSGPYSPIKNNYYKSQQGHLTDASFWSSGSTATNINLIRFADILLWAAEAEVESGSLPEAERYLNMVRNRAANPDGWVHTYIDPNDPSRGFTNIPAANYLIKLYSEGYFAARGQDFARKAIRFERMLELGMEGHRFFDLVRWGIADIEINAYLQKEKKLRTYLDGAVFRKGCNEYFPIPQRQIDLSAGADGLPKMKQYCY